MRGKTRLSFMFLSVCFLGASASAEAPSPRQLPQAQPGSLYAAQLAIPPGLGYPFQECRLSGDTLPRTLVFDCERLQIKGRVPAGIEKTYRLTLRISDAQGNNKTFDLSLNISNKPAIVDLGEPQMAGIAAKEDNVAFAAEAPNLKEPNRQVSANGLPHPKADLAESAYTPVSDIEFSKNANDLQAAAVQLKQTSLSITPTKISTKSHSALSRAKGHAFWGNVNLTCDNVPDTNNAVSCDADAQADLKNILACTDPSKAATDPDCANYSTSLSKIQNEAETASSRLKACVAIDSSLNRIAKSWYMARAAAWDALVADMNAHQDAVKAQRYLPTAMLSQPITGDPLPTAAASSENTQSQWVKEQIGVGSKVTSQSAADYSNNSNVLSKNGIGMQTPVFLLGASFQMPQFDRHFALRKLQSNGNRFSGLAPTSIFANLQFAPNSTNVLNGYTFGFGYRLGSKESPLDFLLGYAVSPYNEPSAGFRVAAAQVVIANAKLSNPLPIYLRYDAAKILDFKDNPDALDGFPVLTQNPDGTQGAPIYSGNVLTTHYRGGLFLGLSFSYDLFGQVFQPKQNGSSSAAK